MKKLLFSVAMLAVAASCTKNEDVVTPKTSEIAFSTLNDRITKAANDAGDDYVVYASLADKTAESWFMPGVTVEEQGTGTAATAGTVGGTYYWDGSDYAFYAYAPEGSSLMGTVTETIDAVSFDYTIDEASVEDLTLGTVAKQSEGVVTIPFTHALAKVTVSYALSQDLIDAGYTLEGTANLGVNYDSATFAMGLDVATPFTIGDKLTDEGGSQTVYTGIAKAESGTFNVIPVSATQLAGYTVQLTDVVIAKSGASSSFTGDLKAYEITGLETNLTSGFVAGKHYTLTVTVTEKAVSDEDDEVFGAAITFQASYTGWATGTTQGIISPESNQ